MYHSFFSVFYFQIENINEPSLIYACIFLLRMKLLETSNTSMFHRLNFLMEGNTNDLENEVTFTSEAFHLMHTKMHLDNLSKEDVIRFMGIKRTNARGHSHISLWLFFWFLTPPPPPCYAIYVIKCYGLAELANPLPPPGA